MIVINISGIESIMATSLSYFQKMKDKPRASSLWATIQQPGYVNGRVESGYLTQVFSW